MRHVNAQTGRFDQWQIGGVAPRAEVRFLPVPPITNPLEGIMHTDTEFPSHDQCVNVLAAITQHINEYGASR